MQASPLSSPALQTGAPSVGWSSFTFSSFPRKGQSGQQSASRRSSGGRGQRTSSGQLCRALSGNPLDVRVEDKRRSLLRFVQDVQPHDVLDQFQHTAPPSVVGAMQTTVTNLLGALPPAYFSVTISADVQDLAQIMFSMLMTGYMYRNAQYRIDLDHVRKSFEDADSIDFEALEKLGRQESPSYADGTQLTRVTGSVLRWRKDTEGLEEMDAQRYIRNCENEIANLRDQVARNMYARGSGNELLDFIKVQEPHHLKELTADAGSGVMEAMNSYVQRLVGNDLRQTESNATELARILYLLMVVGYSLRQIEVKCDFEASFTVPGLPQGGFLE